MLESHSFIHSHFHPLVWSTLDCNLSIAFTKLEPPIWNPHWLLSTHWHFLPIGYSILEIHPLVITGFVGLASSPLDQRLYYNVNRFVLSNIFFGLSKLLSKFRNIGSIRTCLRSQEIKIHKLCWPPDWGVNSSILFITSAKYL